jgi:L-lactate dehydrogenase complex protein LldG
MVASETDTYALFASVLEQTGGSVERVSTARQVAAVIGDAARGQGTREVLYEPHAAIEELDLHLQLAAHGAELLPIEKAGERAPELRVALTGAELAVAETGTLMVGGRPGGWGLASVLPWVHLVVLRERDLVADLHTGFARFRERLEAGERDWVWITGPSRTADIGHTLVLGAHGPNALRVMVLS